VKRFTLNIIIQYRLTSTPNPALALIELDEADCIDERRINKESSNFV
jgi:hypothetical protein